MSLRRDHLLWCYDHGVDLPPDVEDVYHSHWETNNGAWLVRTGWAEVEYDNQICRAEPGQWLIVRPGHRIQSFPVGTRLFNRDLQTTPHQYFDSRRMEAARRRLAAGEDTVKTVAVSLGFNHLSYFSAWLKKQKRNNNHIRTLKACFNFLEG